MTENKFININPQRQVGASEFWQSPSTRTMEDKNLRTGDHYSTFTVTMKSDDVDSYVAEWRDKGSSSQLVQITVTTLNGGMSQVAIRVQSLYQVQEEENDDDSGGDSDVGGGDTGGSDTDDRESASTTSCHVSF